jgi:type II restriction enzyme
MELQTIISQIKENNNWKSASRIVGEACEEYVKNNVKCVRCNTNQFEKCKTNEKSKDLVCLGCNQNYQIKAKSATQKQIKNIVSANRFKTIGGEYSTTVNNITENIDYLIVLYEKQSYQIHTILYIKSEHIDTTCILPRKALSLTARRAGWQGCSLVFTNIEVVTI